MFNGIIGQVLFGIIFVLLVVLILFHKSIRNLKIFRTSAEKAAERAAKKAAKQEEYFRRTATKHYQPEEKKPTFADDYFKSVEEQKKEEQPKAKEQPQQKQETTARRSAPTDSGVTIIDERASRQSERKIFDDGDGEYVEFEEV